MKALNVYAGPAAQKHLERNGLRPQDIALIPGAAGGPKGLILGPLDRFLFGEWLPQSAQPIDLVGGSIGAWRMAAAVRPDPVAALRELADRYIHQHYPPEPGRRMPTPRSVSRSFQQTLAELFPGPQTDALTHPRYRLHFVTSRGRHVLGQEGRVRSPLGFMGAYATNAAHRRALGGWMERVLFSVQGAPPPIELSDYPTRTVALTEANFLPALLASCSIPFVLEAVTGIPGAPSGAYWDGGVTDYHLHWNYASLRRAPERPPLVLYPHFQQAVVPGWMDKVWRLRHQATPFLENVVVLAPRPEWVATLPNGKLPDRKDFKRYGEDVAGRVQAWGQAIAASEQLAEEFEELCSGRTPLRCQPL